MRPDERAGSSVASVDGIGTSIAAADRLVTEQQTMKNSIKALVAIAHEERPQRNGNRGYKVREGGLQEGTRLQTSLRQKRD